jgi:hypothetical protein
MWVGRVSIGVREIILDVLLSAGRLNFVENDLKFEGE